MWDKSCKNTDKSYNKNNNRYNKTEHWGGQKREWTFYGSVPTSSVSTPLDVWEIRGCIRRIWTGWQQKECCLKTLMRRVRSVRRAGAVFYPVDIRVPADHVRTGRISVRTKSSCRRCLPITVITAGCLASCICPRVIRTLGGWSSRELTTAIMNFTGHIIRSRGRMSTTGLRTNIHSFWWKTAWIMWRRTARTANTFRSVWMKNGIRRHGVPIRRSLLWKNAKRGRRAGCFRSTASTHIMHSTRPQSIWNGI